jgi:integrase
LATKAAANAAEGKDPGEAKRQRAANKVTLAELLEVYIGDKKLKPRTEADYRYAIGENYGDWLDRPASSLTEEMVLARYVKRGKVSEARTDNGFRVLRAVFNYARAKFRNTRTGARLFPLNPTDAVVEANIRFSIGRRRTKIDNADLPPWWAAVHDLAPVYRNWFVFRLLTGARVTEASELEWSDVNLRRRTFWLRDTKTGGDVELPLPEYAAKLLLETKPKDRGEYVFPNAVDEPLVDFKRPVEKIRKATETNFTPYDTRRTFVSTGNALNISRYTIKALVNHSIKGDVTAGYDVPDMDRLREASTAIEERLLRTAKAVSAKVVRLRAQ